MGLFSRTPESAVVENHYRFNGSGTVIEGRITTGLSPRKAENFERLASVLSEARHGFTPDAYRLRIYDDCSDCEASFSLHVDIDRSDCSVVYRAEASIIRERYFGSYGEGGRSYFHSMIQTKLKRFGDEMTSVLSYDL